MGEKKVFSEKSIFIYNKTQKILFGISLIVGALIIVSIALVYLFVLRDYDIPWISGLSNVITNITSNIGNSTLLGVAYASFIGGLFFIYIPLELFFARFIVAGNNFFLVLLIYISGILVSYSINYIVGLKLSGTSKRIISPKKFYSFKSRINKYGALAIFVFNVLPLPSQILAVILGVFRYNRPRFYFFLLVGQVIKCVIIGLGVFYFS